MARGLQHARPADATERRAAIERRNQGYFDRSKPSANRPKFRRQVPKGCVDVYRIHQWDGHRNVYYGVYADEEEAYRIADEMWAKHILERNWRCKIYVDHKAAVVLDGKWFLVNLDAITLTEPSSQQMAALFRPAEDLQ